MNSGQAATLRLNAAIKTELRTERGKKSLIHILLPGTKSFFLLTPGLLLNNMNFYQPIILVCINSLL